MVILLFLHKKIPPRFYSYEEDYILFCFFLSFNFAFIVVTCFHNDIFIVQRALTNGFEVWKLSDLFIRPTFTDIEGLSVKEALFCGTPAIASDVCKRPLEAIIFKNRDFNDLLSKVLEVLNNNNKEFTVIPNDDTIKSILNIYNSIRN